jgi:hypothetical protein
VVLGAEEGAEGTGEGGGDEDEYEDDDDDDAPDPVRNTSPMLLFAHEAKAHTGP